MKKHILASLSFLLSLTAAAQTEVLRIELNDGTVQTVPVGDIREMTFATEEADLTEGYIGQFHGTNSVVVGGMFTYTADITYDIVKGADGTLTVNVPTYSLANTVMGDLTLGAYTISGLTYDEAKGGFYHDYGSDGLQMHFTAVKDGTTSMDKDYGFNPGSEITVTKAADGGIKVVNKFKMGAMPFESIATFGGTK